MASVVSRESYFETGLDVLSDLGYEQATPPRDAAALEWIAGQLIDALDCRRFASVPDGD